MYGMPVGESNAGSSRWPRSSASREEPRIAGQLVRGEQAAEQADRDLEVLHRDVAIELERSSRSARVLPPRR